jgi:phage shock protein PspC (stress-responsive transcriptional regulator)
MSEQTPMPTPPAGPKRLVRSRDRMLGGVCAGVADYFGLDVNLVRILTVIATVLGVGSLVIVYIALWIMLPEE